MAWLRYLSPANENNEQWVPLHEEQAKQSAQGKWIPMQGSHYLHHTKFKEIAREFKAYLHKFNNMHSTENCGAVFGAVVFRL